MMISQDFKELINSAGGRYIIVENGKPKYIVMSFDEYKSAILNRRALQALTEEELIEKINADIALWREGQNAEDNISLDEIEELEDIEYVKT